MKLGEKKLAIEIGRKGRVYYVWAACVGCGKKRWVHTTKGKEDSIRCISCASKLRAKYREENPKWKGGRWVDTQGYVVIHLSPDDQYITMATTNNVVKEHRLVVAKNLGRSLSSYEIVHHKNGIKTDNRIENLELMTGSKHRMHNLYQLQIQKLEEEITKCQITALMLANQLETPQKL